LGLQASLPAEVATTTGIIDLLSAHDLTGRSIGVQLYGTDPNQRLVNFLERAGARVLTVAPYVYADSSQDAAVRELESQLHTGRVDAIAFTSMQQVQRFFDVLGDDAARASLAKTSVAVVGPVVADSLIQRGVQVEWMPEDSYFLKPLTRALEEKLGPKKN
jgi:uroporphyrinogen-III synthase